MIRQNAFFEVLGSTNERDHRWAAAFAGLCVLRLADAVERRLVQPGLLEDSGLQVARDAVASLDQSESTRAILAEILDRIEQEKQLAAGIGESLIRYGRILDTTAQRPLAANVFGIVAELFPASRHPRIHIEAQIARGAAERTLGNWTKSAHCYAQAQHLADVTGDMTASLTARVGTAVTHMTRGNLPGAEVELIEVLAEATEHGLEKVQAIALHDMAAVAHARGDFQRAVHLAYRSLELTTDRIARDRILGDIAAAYAGLGMHHVARDGYSIVAVDSPHQWVRWQAMLNLMELSALEGAEASFDELVERLGAANLDPRLRSYYLLYRAVGSARFGRGIAAIQFDEAREFASRHEFFQVEFEIESARHATEPIEAASSKPTAAETVDHDDEELSRIAEVLMHLRAELTP